MGTASAVGVDDNLATCEACVAVGAADDELPRGVDVIQDVVVEEGQHLVAELGLDAGHEDVDYIFFDLREHLVVGFLACGLAVVGRLDEVIVLCGDDDGMHAQRSVVVAVFDGYLTLGVGSEVSHHLTLLADVGERTHDEVGQVERCGHVVVGLVDGVAEHHTLVAGALVIGVFARDAAVDVGALLMDGGEDAAAVAVELILRLGVADAVDGVACDGLQVDVHRRAHLTHDDHLSGGVEGLDGAVRIGVVSKKLVK